jgi:hypothetical protein
MYTYHVLLDRPGPSRAGGPANDLPQMEAFVVLYLHNPPPVARIGRSDLAWNPDTLWQMTEELPWWTKRG